MVAPLSSDRKTDQRSSLSYNTDMDKGFKHGMMYPRLKTDEKGHPSPRLAVLANPWDSVESDTESLAQEKAYQQQLQMHTSHYDHHHVQSQKENAHGLPQQDGGNEDADEVEREDLQVCDSLEAAAHSKVKKNPTLLQTEYLDTQIQETSPIPSDDACSDLCHGSSWRTNLNGANCFSQSPQISVEESYPKPTETSTQSSGDREGVLIKGEHKYILYTSPALAVTPHMTGSESDNSYHLHPQNDQTNSLTPHCLNCASVLTPPLSSSTKNESHNRFENSCHRVDENTGGSPELSEDIKALQIQESKTYQREPRHAQVGPIQIQQKSTSSLVCHKALSKKKLGSRMEDIVERNKITLGQNMSKCGSYVKAHALKQGTPQNMKKVPHKEASSAESREARSADKLQKRQQLKVTTVSGEKKAQQRKCPSTSQEQQPPAPGVKTEHGGFRSSALAKPTNQPKPQNRTPSQPLPPTIHLNIHLNNPSQFFPLLQQTGQDPINNLASLHGHWSSASEVAFLSGYQQTHPAKSEHVSQLVLNAQLPHQGMESSPEQWQRTTALKGPRFCEGEDQMWNPNGVHTKQFVENFHRTPTTTFSPSLGSYTVLPPIEVPKTGKELELSPGHNQNKVYPIHRSISDGYLVQMAEQQQLRAKGTYKAYTLKDYKQLKSNIKLQGLGPDYTAAEKMKIKRQKLYSDVIRDQNKKISRIPLRPTKDLERSDKKVLRMKALEYAKNIAKPCVQPRPQQRQKHQSEDFTELTRDLEGLDESQISTLELLRKRHEEEKQAVALFRRVHAV